MRLPCYFNRSDLNSYQNLNKLIQEKRELFELQDKLYSCLNKAHALSTLALGENFLNHSRALIFDYLWALNELIHQAKQYQQQLEHYYLNNS